jgi:tRNA (adenine57-N1/adenine58-N1)-methyltransferase catalytic subunit
MRHASHNNISHPLMVYAEITMYETLLRPHEVNTLPALQSVSEVAERLKKAEQKREDKRLRQIASSKLKTGDKRKREGNGEETDGSVSAKKVKSDDDDLVELQDDVITPTIPEGSAMAAETLAPFDFTPIPSSKVNLSKAMPEVRGHTSYLTFACLLPESGTAVEDSIASSTRLHQTEDVG